MYQVFLADDEPWVILGLKNLIDWGAAGFVICGEATDGIKAWERICRLKPDVVFSDIRMPGLSGIDLLKKVREEQLRMEFVIISGYSEFEYARKGLQYGCADYLLKPVYEEDLMQCLEKISGRLKDASKNVPDKEDTRAVLSKETGGNLYKSEARQAAELLAYMQKNYRDVTQQQLADTLGLSTSAVSQLIKKQTGKTYSEHLLDIRIHKAQELLRFSNESIESIAEMTGYNDYFYFVKVFKKATGISPTDFRKNL